MIDSHCHLDDEKYAADLGAVLERARAVGVNAVICPGAGLDDLSGPIRVAEMFENLNATIGVHPYEADKIENNHWEQIEKFIGHPKVVGVGEVGLENSSGAPAMETQIRVLEKMVNLGVQHEKPLIFHVRDAHREFQEFLNSYKHKFPAVMHCFAGSVEDAEYYLRLGFYISISGIVTFPKADLLRNVVKSLSLDRILIETDGPWLAPQAFRGQRNEPAYVVETVKKIAELKGLTVEEVGKATEENTRKLFGIN